ncbi:MAG TPA: hypothetical protein VEX63_03330, partial [Flavisolibacter sp.]|nr:hypothetical protein [Flavisolibacter sp.]
MAPYSIYPYLRTSDPVLYNNTIIIIQFKPCMNLFSTVIPTVSKQFAGKLRLCLFIVLSVLASLSSKAQPNHVVISQVYGGGGNAGATYTHDFVELFNPTTAPISLAGMSI